MTWPGVTGVDPARTVAVRVTVVPAATVVTGAPAAVAAKVVLVAVPAKSGQQAAASQPSASSTVLALMAGRLPVDARAPIYQPHHGTVTPFSGSGSDVLQVARKKVYATERFWRGFVVDKVNGDTA